MKLHYRNLQIDLDRGEVSPSLINLTEEELVGVQYWLATGHASTYLPDPLSFAGRFGIAVTDTWARLRSDRYRDSAEIMTEMERRIRPTQQVPVPEAAVKHQEVRGWFPQAFAEDLGLLGKYADISVMAQTPGAFYDLANYLGTIVVQGKQDNVSSRWFNLLEMYENIPEMNRIIFKILVGMYGSEPARTLPRIYGPDLPDSRCKAIRSAYNDFKLRVPGGWQGLTAFTSTEPPASSPPTESKVDWRTPMKRILEPKPKTKTKPKTPEVTPEPVTSEATMATPKTPTATPNATEIDESEISPPSTTRKMAGDVAAAFGQGAALAIVGGVNTGARDLMLPALPESLRSKPLVVDGLLTLPPLVLLALLDYGVAAGLPIPETGREEVRKAALLALTHAGMKTTEAAIREAVTLILPWWTAYASAGQMLLAQEAAAASPVREVMKERVGRGDT